jgi:CSLREA domain-containing protein
MPRPRRITFLIIFTLSLGLYALPNRISDSLRPAAAAGAFTVNSTGDGADSNTADGVCNDGAGNCTLRAAMQQANATTGVDNINFNIPGTGAHTITISSALPEVTDPVVIDAATQPGYAGSPLVEVHGPGTRVLAFFISAGGSTLRGLSITGLQEDAVVLKTKGNNHVEGNYIGLTPAGARSGFNLNGVLILDSANNVVGGAAASQRNVISTNLTNGVLILGNDPSVGPTSGNVVQGNYIGANPAGTAALGNGEAGVSITSGRDNTVGGTAAGAANVISGNRVGVEITATDPDAPVTFPSGNVVQGNLVGTNAAGAAAIPNTTGVNVVRGSNNLIGGPAAGARNVISGNTGDGVAIDISTNNNSVQGNYIGADATGGAALHNNEGVFVRGTHNVIGGADAGAGNVVAFNLHAGVFLDNPAQDCEVRHNSIHSNGALGIDLGANGSADGVTLNDNGDADSGADGRQNFPVITSASEGGGSVQIQGTLNSSPSTAYTLDFYASPACDATGFGEGKGFVGETTATTDASGNALFNVSFPAPTTGHVITATATDPGGDTSEFSGCSAGQSPASLQFTSANFATDEPSHFKQITVTRSGDTSGAVGVDYSTSDGTASERSDYTKALGRLDFAPGDTSKSFDVLVTDDSYQEGDETVNLTLSNPTGGAVLGSTAAATLTIDGQESAPPPSNTIDDSVNFVRQHYHDFLNREPDADGLQFWTNEIEKCGQDAQCREVKRVNVSAAFFLSIEFQETGYLVYRDYKAAYGDATSPNVAGTVPVIRLNEFLADTQRIGRGLIVGQGDWQARLEANKSAYELEFVQRRRFTDAYPTTMTADEFVSKLDQNAGGVLSASEKSDLAASLGSTPSDASKRASVLRAVAEDSDLHSKEFNRAFVLMEYFGYLRRNPDDAPEPTLNFAGWKFWLDKLNSFNGNFVQAEMVKAFLASDEYRHRFGQ